MAHLIDKDALVAEIERRIKFQQTCIKAGYRLTGKAEEEIILEYKQFLSFLDTLEVKDPYEQCIQYPSVKDGIEAHAETYSFNIESKLFNQLTKEQQALWRKEIEQACISGGEAGYELAKDQRYKENIDVKEVGLQKEIDKEWEKCNPIDEGMGVESAYIHIEAFDMIVRHFFELGLKAKQD